MLYYATVSTSGGINPNAGVLSRYLGYLYYLPKHFSHLKQCCSNIIGSANNIATTLFQMEWQTVATVHNITSPDMYEESKYKLVWSQSGILHIATE